MASKPKDMASHAANLDGIDAAKLAAIRAELRHSGGATTTPPTLAPPNVDPIKTSVGAAAAAAAATAARQQMKQTAPPPAFGVMDEDGNFLRQGEEFEPQEEGLG